LYAEVVRLATLHNSTLLQPNTAVVAERRFFLIFGLLVQRLLSTYTSADPVELHLWTLLLNYYWGNRIVEEHTCGVYTVGHYYLYRPYILWSIYTVDMLYWQLLLSKYAPQQDIVFFTAAH